MLSKAYFDTPSGTVALNLESTGFLGYTGMQHRISLPENDGAVFEFSTIEDHAFWMKNVKIPLDIIFLDLSYRVIHIHAHAKPMSEEPIRSGRPVACVLEANAGWCAKNGVTLGTLVEIAP